MLQPVMTAPSSVSRAAPTLNPGERRDSPGPGVSRGGDQRPARPLPRRRTDLCGVASQRRPMMPSSRRMKSARDAPRGLHDLRVIERLRQHARSHVRDAGDAEHLQSHVTRDDRFGHGRHADGIGADRAKVPDFRRCLVARSMKRRVDAVSDGVPRRPLQLRLQSPAGAASRLRSCLETAARSVRRSGPMSGLLPIRFR